MSFDLKIVNNNLSLNPDGTLQTVRDNSKIVQEIIKGILTPLGSNKFFKWYGSTVGNKTIGELFIDESFTIIEIQKSVQDLMGNIISLQRQQAKTQYVSAGETIENIRDIIVLRNPTDPRQIEITIVVLTRALTEVEATFTLQI